MSDSHMQELKRQFDFYLKNQDDLVQTYNGKVLLIHDDTVVNTFDTKGEAIRYGNTRFVPGEFLVIRCTPGPSEYTVNYRTAHRFSQMVPAV